MRFLLTSAGIRNTSIHDALVSLNSSEVETRSAKSLLEPRVVAYCGEVVVRPRLLAERREQLA